MVLSGGVSTNVNPYQYALDNTTYADYLAQVPTGAGYPDWVGQQQQMAAWWNTQNPAPMLDVSYQPQYNAPVQPAYSVPVSSYQAPTVPVSVGGGGGEPPININNTPVLQSSAVMNVGGMPFPDMPAFNPQGNPDMIQIGGRQYPADSVIASNPVQSFAPGVPQMDTVSDGAYGYEGTRIPAAPSTDGSQPYLMNSAAEELPASLNGIPNPYMTAPTAPNYMQSPAMQAIPNVVGSAFENMPNVNDYMPSAMQYVPPMQRPQNGLMDKLTAPLKQAVWATAGNANRRAAQANAGYERYKTDLNAHTQMMSTMMPGVIGALREAAQQQGADYRINAQAYHHAAQMMLDSLIRQEEMKILSASQALDLAANAFLLPSKVFGDTGTVDPVTGKRLQGMVQNREKVLMLRKAGQFLGWTEADVYGLMNQQDPIAAENLKQEKLNTERQAFDLSRARALLGSELAKMAAETAHMTAQAGLLDAERQTESFNLGQRAKVAKYERWGIIADAAEKVDRMLVNRGTRQARINNANLQNQQLMAQTYRQRMEAANAPVESAAKLASAMASMANSTDPQTRAIGSGLADSVFSALGQSTRPEYMGKDVHNKPLIKQVPVQVPEAIQQYRRRVGPAPQAPPEYFTGQPLSGNRNQVSYGGE